MTWFAFSNGHPDIETAGVEEKTLVTLGFHGYATQPEADAHKNSVNAIQAADLKLWDLDHAGQVGAQKGGSAAGQAAGAAGAGLSSVSQFLGLLGQRALWVRIAKVVLGLGLTVIGIIQLAGKSPTAAAVAKGVVKA
jgi:hypothetical protein